MRPEREPNWSEKIYGLLLLAYPAPFRREFGSEMKQVFRTRARTERRNPRFWKSILADWIVTVAKERLTSAAFSGLVAFTLALAFGIFAAYVDFHNDEVQPPLLVIVCGCFILGLARPRAAWRWALIVGLVLPIAHWLAPQFGIYPKVPPTPNNFAALIVLIPAFIATYAGVIVRRVYTEVRSA